MEKELTIKLNYELGRTGAFDDAASHAESLNKRIGSGIESLYNKVRSHQVGSSTLGELGGTALGLMRGGLGSAAYVGAAGQLTGGIVSDMMMGAGGGLRGRGLSGMNDSFWGMVLGRDTKEAMTDRTMQASGYIADRHALSIAGRESELAVRTGTMFSQSTQVDPIARMKEERAIMVKRQLQSHQDYQQLIAGRDEGRKLVNKFHDEQHYDDEAEGQRARIAALAKYDNNYLEARKRLAEADLQRVTEINNFDKQVFEQRKSSMRGSQMQWGGMTLAQQQSTKISLDLLKNKQPLMPEQIAMLHSIPEAKESLDEYLLKAGKDSGHAAAVAGLKGDMGRANAISQGVKSSTGLDIDPENFLDAKQLFDASEKLKKMLGSALADVISRVTENNGWLMQMMQGIVWQRGKQGDPK